MFVWKSEWVALQEELKYLRKEHRYLEEMVWNIAYATELKWTPPEKGRWVKKND